MILILEQAIRKHVRAHEDIKVLESQIATLQNRLEHAIQSLEESRVDIGKFVETGVRFYRLENYSSVLKVTNLRAPTDFKIEFHEITEVSE